MKRGRAPRVSTGIEIDASSLRVAQVAVTADGFHLDGLYERELPAGLFEAGTPLEVKTVARELRSLLKENGLKVRGAHLSAANEPSILKLITPPPLQGQQLDAVLEYEFKKHLPLSEEEAEIRYETVTDQDELRILVGAVRKNHVQALMNLAGAAGVKALSLEPRTLSALRAAPCHPDAEAEVLVDIAGDSASISGRNPNTLFMNRISEAGDAAFQEDARAASRALISDMDDVVQYITNQVTTQFQLIFTGTAWQHPELIEMVERHFNRKAEHPGYHEELRVPAEVTQPSFDSFTTAIGLALKGDKRK